MRVVIDTHVLYWVLTQDLDKLTNKALGTISQAEEIIVPTIVLLELLGLLQKKKATRYFDILLKQFPKSKYIVVPLDIAVIKEIRKIKAKFELHDKVIVATAKGLGLSLVTKDEEITKKYKRVIW